MVVTAIFASLPRFGQIGFLSEFTFLKSAPHKEGPGMGR